MERPETKEEVERLNDAFARENDIDAYYRESGFLIGFIEQRRLSIIKSLMNAKHGEKILEVGCGGGHVLSLFREAELTGVDVSGEMLEKAKKNLSGANFQLLKG